VRGLRRFRRIGVFAVRVVCLASTAPRALAAQEGDSRPRPVTIEVVSSPNGAPLGYAVVGIAALGIERFTGENGAVSLLLNPGQVRVSAKRLGFLPKDTIITIGDAPLQRVRISLVRLTYSLRTVRVDAKRECAVPGTPRADVDPVSRDVLEQLKQNAERFDLLLKTYPFVYTLERTLSETQGVGGAEINSKVDTMLLSGLPRWSYKPGTLLYRSGRSFRSNEYSMRLPSLRDFASPAFIDNHCFRVVGVEEKAGQRLLRMDIVAAARLRDPDVDATVWLDTTDFRIRFATLELTRLRQVGRELERVTSEITYLELLPYVPVMYHTFATNFERAEAAIAWRWLERQQVLDVQYLGAHPDSTRRDSTATRPPDRTPRQR
jgi:hypothetical protein